MGFRYVVIFIESFIDDVTYVRDVEGCMWSTICYMPRCVCCGYESFGLGSVGDDSVGLGGTTAQFCYVAPYRIDCCLVDG